MTFFYGDDFPADGDWPDARNSISLAELSGVTPEHPDMRAARRRRMSNRYAPWPAMTSLAELSGVVPERSDTRAARRRPIPDRLSWTPAVISLAELSGVTPERAGPRVINMAAVRDLVDEKRQAMSANEWAKATEDGAMVARGLRALKTLPDPQAAMPAFRRKMAAVGVTESTIANLPRTWDPRLADVVIAAHGEMGKLPAPPSREPQTRGTQDSAPEVLSPTEMNRRAGGERVAPDRAENRRTGVGVLVGSGDEDAYSYFRRSGKGAANTTFESAADVGSSTDEPVDCDEMYGKLDFDPVGRGERIEALHTPVFAVKAGFLRSESDRAMVTEIDAGRLPAGPVRNNEADAFRHAYWSYRVAQEMGAEVAKRFGDGHEISAPNDDSERLKDLYNNHVGRQLALNPKNRGRPANEVILEALRNGLLRTKPFRVRRH